MTAQLGATLIAEFGLDATGPNDPTFTWTAVGEIRTDDGVTINRGRTADSPTITPGTASFVLGNIDRRLDAGGTLAQITTGTPVRIRLAELNTYGAHYGIARFGVARYGIGGGAPATVFRGVVDGRPTERRNGVDRVVLIDALDALGLAAQAEGTPSAWDATIAALATPPDMWWRLGASEWIDRQGDRLARHTSGTIEAEPLVDGGDRAFQSSDLTEGYGVIDAGQMIDHDTDTEAFAVSMWVRLAAEAATDRSIILVQQLDDDGNRQFELGVDPALRLAYIVLGNTAGCTVWHSDAIAGLVDLLDGRAHHVMVDGGFDIDVNGDTVSELARLVVDGREIKMLDADTLPTPTATSARLHLAGGRGLGTNAAPVPGAVDHVMIWNDHPFVNTLVTTAQAFTTAGRQAWAGDTLDTRLERILDAAALGTLAGTFDASTIEAAGPYRTGSVLTLCQAIEDTEQGRVWVDRNGMVRFTRRSWAWTKTTATEVQAWFSTRAADVGDMEPGDALPIAADSLIINDDPRTITNVADVTSEGGRTQTVENAASITTYGRRNPASLTGLLHRSDRESLSIAQWLTLSRGTPQTRIVALSFNLLKDPRLVDAAMALDEGHLVKVTDDTGDLFGHVVGFVHDITADGWTATLQLDATRTGYSFFRCDESTTDGPDGLAF